MRMRLPPYHHLFLEDVPNLSCFELGCDAHRSSVELCSTFGGILEEQEVIVHIPQPLE